MNPAALRTNLPAVAAGGTVIVNTDEFTAANLRKAGYDDDPIAGDTVGGHQLFKVPITTLTMGPWSPSSFPRSPRSTRRTCSPSS